jgi:hypothetical protein
VRSGVRPLCSLFHGIGGAESGNLVNIDHFPRPHPGSIDQTVQANISSLIDMQGKLLEESSPSRHL